MTAGVYCIQGPGPTYYIGSSLQIETRLAHHRGRLRAGKHCNPHLQHAWTLHGEHSFATYILEPVTRPEDVLASEQRWLDLAFAWAPRLYNCNPEATAPPQTPEAKEKRRASCIGRVWSADQRNAHALAWDRKRANGTAKKGAPMPQEQRDRIALAVKGVRKPCKAGDRRIKYIAPEDREAHKREQLERNAQKARERRKAASAALTPEQRKERSDLRRQRISVAVRAAYEHPEKGERLRAAVATSNTRRAAKI